MKRSIVFLVTLLMISGLTPLQAQGCSDAGICTLNSFKPDAPDSLSKSFNNQVKLGLSYGVGDQGISVFANYLEYIRQVSQRIRVDVKLTSISQRGNGISSLGFSDLFLSSNLAISNRFSLIAGAKIPFSDGNQKDNGLALPMDFQTSLGTLDLILGVSYQLYKIRFALAFQQPLTDNKNEFLVENHPENAYISRFQSTNGFERQADALLRISYPFTLTDKLSLSPSLLWIYHVQNDKFSDFQGIENEIIGSRGSTVNINGFLDYKLSDQRTIQVSLGAPVIWRKIRPDGLTRYFMLTGEYRIRF